MTTTQSLLAPPVEAAQPDNPDQVARTDVRADSRHYGPVLGDAVALDGPPRPSSRSQLTAYLPHAVLATLLVAVCPVALVWGLRAAGLIQSTLLTILLGLVLSTGASYLGGVIWKSRPGSGDVLFCELMLWGWLRRWRVERQLESVQRLLEGLSANGEVDKSQRTQLLTKLAGALEAGDPYTHGHSRRVARHATMIAERLGLSPEVVAKVRTAAVLHDIGKINTPTEVLHKPDRLTDAEFDVIKRHPVDGAVLVADLGDDELTAMIRHHHERLDGTGYPERLFGEMIPLGARIIAVADTFDAITSTRPYRSARSHKRAMAILSKEAGSQLDVAAVEAFQIHYSGHRAFRLWLTLMNVPESIVAWLSGGLNAAASTSQVMAATALTGAVASAAVAAPAVHSAALRHTGSTAATTIVRTPQDQAGHRSSSPGQSAQRALDHGRARHGTAAGGAVGKQSASRGHSGAKAIGARHTGAEASRRVAHAHGSTTASTSAAVTSSTTTGSATSSSASSGTTASIGAAPGHSGAAPGHSGSAPGHSGSAPGHSGSAPGHSGSAPGHSGAAPGHSGSAPSSTGSTPTTSGSSPGPTPGQSGSAPGQSGSTPGQSGSAPGHSGSAPGHSGSAPGHSG